MVVFLLVFMACTKEDAVITQKPLGTKVELSFDTELTYQEGVKIKFTKVDDSRCPQSVTCVWAGMAKVFFRITDKGVSKDSSVDFDSKSIKTIIDLSGVKYEVEISDVLPFPKNTTEINQKDYKVSITVRKL